MVNGIVIDEAIIDEINDMLEDGELVLDENGRIIDYRDIDIELSSVSKTVLYCRNGIVDGNKFSVEFYVGEALYKVVAQTYLGASTSPGEWFEPKCKARLVPQTAYLMVYNAKDGDWLVQARCEWSKSQNFHQHAEYLVREYIASVLRLPTFEF